VQMISRIGRRKNRSLERPPHQVSHQFSLAKVCHDWVQSSYESTPPYLRFRNVVAIQNSNSLKAAGPVAAAVSAGDDSTERDHVEATDMSAAA